jgi:hypothetical protein
MEQLKAFTGRKPLSKSEKIALEKFESFITSLKSQDFPLPQTVRNLPPRNQDVLVYVYDLYDAEMHEESTEKKYSDWIDTFDKVESPDWDSESGSDLETLAWYEDISRYGPKSRIVLTDRGIGIYASIIRRNLLSSKVAVADCNRKSIVAAIEALLAHELFHHRVEWYALTLTNSFFLNKSNRYLDYHSKVYAQLRKPLSDDLLEESLATAAMILNFPKDSKIHSLSQDEIEMVKEAIKSLIPHKPKGYRKGVHYLTPAEFKQGKLNLGATILNASQTKVSFVKGLPIVDFNKSKLDKYYREFWDLELTGSSGVSPTSIPPFAFSLDGNKLKRYLAGEGYSDSGFGKGSHQVWKAPNRPSITLPQRKNYEGNQALKNVVRALGLKNLRELEERVRNC